MEQLDLIQTLKAGPSYDHAVICTYEFDAEFFERYALTHFKSMSNCEAITIATDRAVYQSLCNAGGYHPTEINRTYLVEDFAAADTFHPKLILLISAQRGKLLVGSANFTQPAFTKNAELVTVLSYDETGDRTYQSVFCGVYQFLRKLTERVPQTTFASNIDELAKVARWLEQSSGAPSKVRFVDSLTRSLLDQTGDLIATGKIDEYQTLSPFFDNKLAVLDEITKRWQPNLITIITQDGSTTLPTEKLSNWCRENADIQVRVKLVEFLEAERQHLHAKLHIFRTGRRCVCLVGSPNCTSAALLGTTQTGNIETAILFDSSQAIVESLFPRSLVRLRSVESLSAIHTSSISRAQSPSFPLRLSEVLYEKREDALRVTVERLKPCPDGGLLLELSGFISDEKQVCHLPLRDIDVPFMARLGTNESRLLEAGSARARLLLRDKDQEVQVSGWRWVDNTSSEMFPVRIERAKREAKENPNKFDEVLQELTERDDTAAIIDFLEYCNIPVEGLPHRQRPRARMPYSSHQISLLGPRMRRERKNLRNAIETFCKRHIRKLKRHLQKPKTEGLANFLHISEIIVRALNYHREYELSLLPVDRVMTAYGWGDFLDQVDAIVLIRYNEVLDLMNEYLANLFPAQRVRQELLQTFPERIQSLIFLHEYMLHDTTKRIAEVSGKYHVLTDYGTCVFPPFLGDHKKLEPGNWENHCRKMDEKLARISRYLTGQELNNWKTYNQNSPN